MELSERKKKILASVVEKYIATGEPVGSKVLCGSLSVSSATVRNEMSELSEMGYLEQPHTSAGRIPSQKGLRYYINYLMTRYAVSDAERFAIDSGFDNAVGEPVEILRNALRLLTDITGCAAIASTPYDAHSTVKRVEIVPLSPKTVLMILLSSTGIIKTRICRCESEMDIKTAELFYNIAGAQFIGHHSYEMTTAKIQTLAASLGDKVLVMTPLLVTLSELAHEASRSDIIVDGQSRLLNFKELDSSVYDILEVFKHASQLSRILSSGKESINVCIGRECMNRSLENASVVFSKYKVGGRDVGSMGIVGPVRMDYAKIIPCISYIGETVGNILSETIEE